MWQYAASMGISMISAGLQAKEQMKAEGAANALRAEQRRLEQNRETEAAILNIKATKRQESTDMMNIDLAAQRAEDEALIATAGTGLTGGSFDDINAEILVDINKDKVSVKNQASQSLDSITRDLRYSNENRGQEAKNAKINTNSKSGIRNAALSSLGGSLFSVANKFEATPAKKDKKDKKEKNNG